MKPAVFLDRDGVLVRSLVVGGKPVAPPTLHQMEIESGARRALERLKRRGFLLVVVSNQPDVARGEISPAVIADMGHRLMDELPLDAVWTCPHDDNDGCACRKPKPGMILAAATALDIDLGRSFMVGDRWRDVDAGQAAGCLTVWLDRGYNERAPAVSPAARVSSLEEAVDWILARSAGVETDESPL
ncbi:MAG: D-glycero-alpha-D-manno-heptose-1,7-bisphosphate 7-phosphatase [Bryobacteraceae bacterium]